MLWAACCVGFFGFLRVAEFTAQSREEFDPSASLMLEDLAVDQHENPSRVQIRLKQSKMDPFGMEWIHFSAEQIQTCVQ
jgi:hypothetical protein